MNAEQARDQIAKYRARTDKPVTTLRTTVRTQDGTTVHVRLYIQHADTSWSFRDYVYTAAGAPAARSRHAGSPGVE